MVQFTHLLERVRRAFASGKTRSIEWRKQQLLALIDMLEKEADGFCQAMYKDLKKHRHEALFMEVNLTKNDAILAYNRLDDWVQPQKAEKNLLTMTDNVYIHYEPYGLSLIIGAWNYPVQLVLLPLIGAISAGNCAVIKPSEVSPATADFLEEVIPKYMDNDCIHVVNGGIPETQALLAERWDLIFYTGNNVVAKIVAEAAAKHLTPTVLELGGKSPCYVDESSDIDLAARRILWGKFVNCGQTCIAPDYVMCKPEIQDKLLESFRANLELFYGSNPQESEEYGRMVNSRHFGRVLNIVNSSNVAIGGNTDESENFIEPTVLKDCQPHDVAMKDEIFGPVLPIMTVRDEDEAIDFINSREKPLAMYVFSKDKKQVSKMIHNTSSGGVTVNDTIMHAAVESLPFGGIGHSGMGAYHGKFSFETFSHKRAVLEKQQKMESINNLRYPPYTDRKSKITSWVMGKKVKRNSGIIGGVFSFFRIIIIGVVLGFVAKKFGFDKYLPDMLK